MSRHIIDKSRKFSLEEYQQLLEERLIEIPDVEPVPEKKPKTRPVSKEPYLPDKKLIEVVNLAIALGRPLLLQGEPGCGKTRLAYAVAYALGLPLEVCYIKSTSRAQDLLYTYDAVSRLYDAQLGKSSPIEKYIHIGPLGRAIIRAQYGRSSVVLIDEIDKADLDFPNDLLWELDRLEFRVNEAPNMHYTAGKSPEFRPIVFVTDNEEKALPTAFLRRCIFHYLRFPEEKSLVEKILELHIPDHKRLSPKAVEVIKELRDLELSKKPGLSELIDWVGYLEFMQISEEELDKLPYIEVLLKQEHDQQRAIQKFRQ